MSTDLAAPDNSLNSVRQSLAHAEKCASLFQTLKVHNELNSVTLSGTLALSELRTTDLTSLIERGHLVDLTVRAGEWRLHMRRGGRDGDVTESDGSLSAAVDQRRLDDLTDALDTKDFSAILRLLQGLDAHLTIKILNDPHRTGKHWIVSREVLHEVVRSLTWVPFARTLASGPFELVVDDLEDTTLLTDGIAIVGPRGVATAPTPEERRSSSSSAKSDALYRGARVRGDADPYPSPLLFANPKRTHGERSSSTEDVIASFNALASLLMWALLASSSQPTEGGVHIAISGARELDLDINPVEHPDTGSLHEMYRWVATSPEIDRLYYVQQALTLAIVTSDDVHTAAAPALRTAKSLYELSRRNSVAEVMAARRSAREIALAASRSAAGQARDSSAKTVERTALQMVAAAGVLIAQFQKALSPWQTSAILAAIGGLCVLFAILTDCVTLRSARDGLAGELVDLNQYRDSLSTDDIVAVKSSGSIVAANRDLRRARWSTWLINGVASLMLFAIAIALVEQSNTPSQEMAPPRPSSSPSSK